MLFSDGRKASGQRLRKIDSIQRQEYPCKNEIFSFENKSMLYQRGQREVKVHHETTT